MRFGTIITFWKMRGWGLSLPFGRWEVGDYHYLLVVEKLGTIITRPIKLCQHRFISCKLGNVLKFMWIYIYMYYCPYIYIFLSCRHNPSQALSVRRHRRLHAPPPYNKPYMHCVHDIAKYLLYIHMKLIMYLNIMRKYASYFWYYVGQYMSSVYSNCFVGNKIWKNTCIHVWYYF